MSALRLLGVSFASSRMNVVVDEEGWTIALASVGEPTALRFSTDDGQTWTTLTTAPTRQRSGQSGLVARL